MKKAEQGRKEYGELTCLIVSTVDDTTEVAAVVTDETTPVDAVGDATGSSPVKAPKAGPYLLVGSEGAGSPAMLVSAGANSDTGSLKLVVAVPTGDGSFCKLSGTAPGEGFISYHMADGRHGHQCQRARSRGDQLALC